MSNSIKLSPKHGVNPSLCVCFFCGKSKGIALMGRIGDGRKGEDIEAPRECVMDYEPCDECASVMSQGVSLIEVSETQPSDNRPPMNAEGNKKVYPLGGLMVLRPEAVERMFNMQMDAGQCVFVDSEIMKKLREMQKQAEAE